MKKVIIIGAGISGLAAGVYGLKNGYDVEIYEKHSIAGGECTGWNRGKYHFDGCIHWLMGSKKGNSLNKVWREVGALDDSVEIINRPDFGQFELEGRRLTLFKDVDRLKDHLMELSPQDEKEIIKICRAIKGLRKMEIPLDKPFELMGTTDFLKMSIKFLPYGPYMKYGKIDIVQLAKKFKDPLIRTALTETMPSSYSALALLTTLASMSDGDSGWPVGGSKKFAERIEEKFKSLGGKIFFKSPVKRIVVEDGIAKGIELTNGDEIFADYVIAATDGHEALYNLLDGGYLSDLHKKMYSLDNMDTKVSSSFQVWAGINTDLSHEPDSVNVQLPQSVKLGGGEYQRIGFKNYSYDPTMVPPQSSVISCYFSTDDFEYWSNLYNDKDAYKNEKSRIANFVKAEIEKQFPSTGGKIETIDVATPMTYVRYCNAWRGAWMSWVTTPKLKVRSLPMKLTSLSNFVMASQWIMPPGGLPTAVISGKWAIQHLCNDDNQSFSTE